MVSGICFKTHSRCIHALLVQLTGKFNKTPPRVFGKVCAGLCRSGGTIRSWHGAGPETGGLGPASVKELDLLGGGHPPRSLGWVLDEGTWMLLQRRKGAGVRGSRASVLPCKEVPWASLGLRDPGTQDRREMDLSRDRIVSGLQSQGGAVLRWCGALGREGRQDAAGWLSSLGTAKACLRGCRPGDTLLTDGSPGFRGPACLSL